MRYQLLAMDSTGRLYRFCTTQGWHRWSRSRRIAFASVNEVRDYLSTHVIQELPGGVDAYIAETDQVGMVRKTYPVLAPWGDAPFTHSPYNV